MFDVNFVIKNIDIIVDSMHRRNVLFCPEDLLKLIKDHSNAVSAMQNLQTHRNKIAAQIPLIRHGNLSDIDESTLLAKGKSVNLELDHAKSLASEIEVKLLNILHNLPNILDLDVPNGKCEKDNIELRRVGELPNFNFTPLDHVKLGEALGVIDFETATKIAGSRFTILKGTLSLLERALKNFMLDLHTNDFNYTECSIPLLVNEKTMFGVGQLPKFENCFQTTDGRYLISTAEVSLTNFVTNQILHEEQLPLRLTACSTCFRSEAGSAGIDTKGMIRQHQFDKVELVSITLPEKSQDEHDRIVSAAENVLKKLDLPYRIVVLCGGDTGFCAQKTYDLEVWMPGQNKYREISSCSNTGAFQMRRMNTRIHRKNGHKEHPHSLNGSGLAIGRTIIAIMENYQNEDGTITIPSCLRSYMNGMQKIDFLD